MGRRFGQLAGIFGFIIMMGRLAKLLATGPNEPQWNLILTAAAFLGGVAWWLLGQTTSRLWAKLVIFIAGGLLLAFRISAPETLAAGVLPSADTLGVFNEQFDLAFATIRSGVPPVPAEPGLLSILAIVMWSIGAMFTWGNTGGPFAAMFLPPMVMYFQFAVFDRAQAGLGWMAVSSMTLGLSVVALALERREETGRARSADGRPIGRRAMQLAGTMALVLTVAAVAVADSASGLINEYGNAPWRGSGSGYGDGIGGRRYDRLVDLSQRVLNQSDDPVFEVTLGPGAPPPGEIFFRMETLDTWDGENWDRSDYSPTPFQPERGLANPYDIYQGTSFTFTQSIFVRALRQEVAPVGGVPVDILDPPDTDGRSRRPREFQVLSDSALILPDELGADDAYTVRSVHASLRADLGVMATGEDGNLTPLFAAAAEAGEFPHQPGSLADAVVEPPNLDFYTELPDATATGIAQTASRVTAGSESHFEAAWRLQSFFRDGDNAFTYDAAVTTGHTSLILDDWLNDGTSRNYRTGYCEQFAAAMAVMARTLNIPSRVVWGFTPGSVETQSNGTDKIVVRDRNAHAWVEIWIDGVGWAQFDPTPRREQTGYLEQAPSITAEFNPVEFLPEAESNDPLSQPEIDQNFGEEPPLLDSDPNPLAASGPRWWLILIVAALPLLAIVPSYKKLRRRRRVARVREGDITAAWDEIVDRLTDLGQPIPPSLTPIEVARSTDPALIPLAVSYASTIYGGRSGQARDSDLYGVEWWIDRTYDGSARARAALSLKSLLRRG